MLECVVGINVGTGVGSTVKQVLDAPRMIGIRLADFADGLPYAAFLDADGKVGLIDREGQQAAGPDGQPLRFTYVGRAADGPLPACDAAAPFRPFSRLR